VSKGKTERYAIAHFVTKLPKRIRLDGEYEVGLVEIVYPHTCYYVDNGDKKYWIAVIEVGRNGILTVHLPSGCYESRSNIATVFNRQLSQIVQTFKAEFSYSKIIEQFSLSF
jgi:hypothetical protein